MLIDGKGVEKDYKEARKLLQYAASAGEAKAMYKLGWMEEEGVGAAKNLEKAFELYKKACE